MPKGRSYHVFLLEDGEIFSLVTQLFLNIQPSLRVTSDMVIFLSSTITRVSDQYCKPITARQMQQCIAGRLEDKMRSLNMTCIPIQVRSLYPSLLKLYPQCTNETEAVDQVYRVSSYMKSMSPYVISRS